MSSNFLEHAKHKGLPPSLYDVFQEMGHVDRLVQALFGSNTYEVHLSLLSAVSLYLRITNGYDPAERRRLLFDMQEVLMMFVTPNEYYHSFIELYFELVPKEKQPCGNNCSYCRGVSSKFTERSKKRVLQSLMATKLLQNGKTSDYKIFVKSLKENKATIFHDDNIPDKKIGHIHVLVLQLITKGIIALGVSNATKTGKKYLNDGHKVLSLPKTADDDGISLPAYMVDSSWEGLNLV